jgi:hypothetical protein
MRHFNPFFGISLFMFCYSCSENSQNNDVSKNASNKNHGAAITDNPKSLNAEALPTKKAEDYLPEGYVLFDKINGDLNMDGTSDCVIILKGTNRRKIIVDPYRGKLDRNRRGILVLFGKGDGFELKVQNLSCFSSENEDGGVYYPPELDVQINRGNLYVNYGQGRYGNWCYTFRYRGDAFQMIGYDYHEMNGPRTVQNTSINFLTHQKIVAQNTNEDWEETEEEEHLVTTKSVISASKLIHLDEVKDFDQLDFFNE